MNITQSKGLFLLGGYDLEMLTIKQLLEGRDDCVVIDKHLRWDNAYLSAYKDELQQHTYNNIYGIELQEDVTPPLHYHCIDHHNDWNHKPSALEQVSKVIGTTLNRYQQLVAANDRGYIPAMQNLSATKEEIGEIRRRDREAQGVTEAEERQAEEAIENHLKWCGTLAIVKSQTSRFSPICDRLYPYQRLFIYTDQEWMFYGEGKKDLAELLKEAISQKKVFHGGGDNGYIGCVRQAFSKEEIETFVNQLKQKYEYI